MLSVFRGGVVRTNLKNYPSILSRIVNNIEKIPSETIKEMKEIHMTETEKVITSSELSGAGKGVLVDGIKIKDLNKETIKIHSLSDVGAFFEQGVRPHKVTLGMESIYGYHIALWMAENGINGGFIVGGPDSTLSKSNPLKFMYKGYDKSWKESKKIIDKKIKKI